MPPQHIFISNYKNYSEITDTKKFGNIFLFGLASGWTFNSTGSSLGYFNEFAKRFNFSHDDNQPPKNFNVIDPKQYANYKLNNSTCEEWRSELNKCYSIMKKCDHLRIIELQKEIEKCH